MNAVPDLAFHLPATFLIRLVANLESKSENCCSFVEEVYGKYVIAINRLETD